MPSKDPPSPQEADQFAAAFTAGAPARSAIPPFAALRAFDSVARLGGIRKAAEFLGIDHAVISRHLRGLEAWTETSLFERGPGGTSLTEAGRSYHRRIALAIDQLAVATGDLMHRRDMERLRIWCAPGFASGWLVPRLNGFKARTFGLELDIRPSERAPDFNRYEGDIDLRYVADYDPPPAIQKGVQSIEIASPLVIPVASPAYLAQRPSIETVEDLLVLDLLHEESFANWRCWFSRQAMMADNLPLAGPKFWHANMTVEAARSGTGIALANIFLAGDDIAAGRLVELGKGNFERVSLGSYFFYARADRWETMAVAKWRNWLFAEVGQGNLSLHISH